MNKDLFEEIRKEVNEIYKYIQRIELIILRLQYKMDFENEPYIMM